MPPRNPDCLGDGVYGNGFAQSALPGEAVRILGEPRISSLIARNFPILVKFLGEFVAL
jgi:hypothetical protein